MIFELTLTEEKVKPHQITALHLLSALAFLGTGAIFYWLFQPVLWWVVALLVGSIVLLFITVFKNRWLVRPNINKVFRVLEVLTIAWLIYFTADKKAWPPTVMYSVLMAAVLFALYWENAGGNNLSVHIDAQGIKMPLNSRKRSLEWKEVEKILLRYGTLTIDCENNQMYQWNVKAASFDNDAFETFCINKIEEGRQQRTDDW